MPGENDGATPTANPDGNPSQRRDARRAAKKATSQAIRNPRRDYQAPDKPPIYSEVERDLIRGIFAERAASGIPTDPNDVDPEIAEILSQPTEGRRTRVKRATPRISPPRGEKPLSQDATKELLRELKPGEKIKIELGAAARRLIATFPSAGSIPNSVLSVYRISKSEDGTTWTVDLRDKSGVPLTTERENDVPRSVTLVKTQEQVTPALIDLASEGIQGEDKSTPPPPLRVAGLIGDVMHILADRVWKRAFGQTADYLPEFDIGGRRPDVYNPETGVVGEYGTVNQAMRKAIIAAIYAVQIKNQFGIECSPTVYLYDHNPKAWRDYIARTFGRRTRT